MDHLTILSVAILAQPQMSQALFFQSFLDDSPPLLWKAWAYEQQLPDTSGKLAWELRRLLEHCGEKFESGVGRYLKDTRKQLQPHFTACNVHIELSVLPSACAFERRDPHAPAPIYIKKEFQITTKALVALFLYQIVKKRKSVAKAKAKVVFRSLLMKVLGADGIAESLESMGVLDVPPQIASMCNVREPGCADCIHLARARSLLGGSTEIGRYMWAFFVIAQEAENCLTCTEWLPIQVVKISGAIEENVEGCALPSVEHLDVRAVVMQTQVGKRRRLDDDLYKSMLHDRLQHGDARSVGALARATPGIAESTLKSQLPAFMGDYRAALMLAMSQATDVAICFDATRVGCPKEDVLATAVKNLGTNVAGWLAPQVIWALTPRSLPLQ